MAGIVGHQSDRYAGFHRVRNKMWGAKVFKNKDSPFKTEGHTHSVFSNQSPLNQVALPEESKVPFDQITDVRMLTPDVRCARLGIYVLSRMGLENTDLMKDGKVRFSVQNGPLEGDWCMKVEPFKPGVLNKMMQWLPFTRAVRDRHVNYISIAEAKEEGIFQRVKKCFTKAVPKFTISVPDDVSDVKIPSYDRSDSLEDNFCKRPFTDPFTRLASFAFQNIQTEFRHTLEPENQYQFFVAEEGDNKGQLTLVKTASIESEFEKMSGQRKVNAIELAKDKNRAILRDFKRHVHNEYGSWFVKDIKFRMGVDLEKMIKYGEPLLPEHVYRMNVGAHEVDEPVLARIIFKINKLLKSSDEINGQSLEHFWKDYNAHKRHEHFCFRELRSIISSHGEKEFDFETTTVADLKDALRDMFGGEIPRHIQDASSEQVEHLYRLLEPTPEDFDGMFTGRKITDHAIMGYYTCAEKTNFKPWLDLQELIQVFGDMRTCESWDDYYELLSHVVSKKHNVVRDREDFWRVGRVMPAPDGPDGSRRFYIVSSCTDDGNGDFNYTLEPASTSYDPPMPAIKLYRSTASDKYAMNGSKSIDADLSLSGPGASNREAADEYENPFFDRMTIPVWVGYTHLATEQMKDADKLSLYSQKYEKLKEAHELLQMAWRDKRMVDADFKEEFVDFDFNQEMDIEKVEELSEQLQRMGAKLEFLAKMENERIEDKKGSDIVFAGHSLGGALAQGGLYHYGVSRGRIPLPGHKYVCYASDPPGMARHENASFLLFGRTHEKLLVGLGQKWKVVHQMEYGDPVPMGGSVHLGATTRFDLLYKDWLDMDVRVFKPLDTAQSLEITQAPTHGRRVGHSKEGRDYKMTHLTASELNEYDNNINPLGEGSNLLRQTFGYKIIHSRRGAEAFRQGIAYVRAPILRRMKKVWKKVAPERGDEMRDKNGAFFVRLNYSNVLGRA